MLKPLGNRTSRPYLWALSFWLLLLIFNLFFTENFWTIEVRDGHLYGSLLDVLRRAAPTVLLSMGMTLVIATGGIDLSVGAVIAIAGSAAALLARAHCPLLLVVAAPLALAAVAGLWNGLLVTRLGIQPFVATLILMVSGRGIAQLLCGGQIVRFSYPAFEFLSSGFLLGLPFSLYVTALLCIGSGLAARRTALGLFVEAIGINPSASRYAGVNASAVKALVYVLSALCAGVAGLLLTTEIRAADANNVGLNLELDAILATVIGGTPMTGGRFCLLGSIIGALIIQTLTTTILAQGVLRPATLVVKALVVILISLMQSPSVRAGMARMRAAL